MANGGGQRRVLRGLKAVLTVVSMIAPLALLPPASAQISAVAVSGAPLWPSSVRVGDQNQPGGITMSNQSVGTVSTQPVQVANIRLNPSCANSSPVPTCSQPEPRPAAALPVFAIDSPAVGRAGTACAGITFAVSAPNVSGMVVLAPSAPVVLGPSAIGGPATQCTIDLTFDVVQRPLDGGTSQIASLDASVAGLAATTVGTSAAAVSPAIPSILTRASPQTVTAGQLFSDTATVTGVPFGPALGGTVSFLLYRSTGPAFPDCTEVPYATSPPIPVIASTPDPVSGAPRATASYTPLPAPPVGGYVFRAVYDEANDVNYTLATGSCEDPLERVTVNPSPPSGGRYVPLSPVRIEDTRFGLGELSGPLGPNATVEVQVGGRGGVPEGASAVVLNVTATQPTAHSFLTLFPAGTVQPLTSNLNVVPGQTVPNLVVVRLGVGGRVAMYNLAGDTHVIYDVAGYFDEVNVGNAGRYQPLPPARIADTRLGVGGVRLGPGQSFDLQVSGQGGAPATGVAAAVLNVAVTNTTAPSFLTIYPTGEAQPLVSNVNFNAGDTVSNRSMVKLGAGGRVTIYNSAGGTDVVVDLGGTYTDASAAGSIGGYTPVDPARILDTRNGTGAVNGPIPPSSAVEVQVTGRGGVPASGVRAVILSVVVTQPAAPGFLTLFPSGTALPLASDLTYAAGETRPNLVVVQLGANGKVGLYTLAQAHVVFDVAGWFS